MGENRSGPAVEISQNGSGPPGKIGQGLVKRRSKSGHIEPKVSLSIPNFERRRLKTVAFLFFLDGGDSALVIGF